MLNKFRDKLSIITDSIAKILVSIGFKAWHISILGLILTILAGYTLLTYKNYFGVALSAIIYLLGGLMDSLDGSVARIRGEVSAWGGVLDAYLDRVEEVIYIIFVQASWLNPNPLNILTFLSLSLLISYGRCKAAEYNINMRGVGLMERAERILALGFGLILLPLYTDIDLLILLINVLLLYTLAERVYRIYQGSKELAIRS